MKKRIIPFRFLPASWGLVGAAYDEAEAHYTLSGEELDRRLLEIRYKDEPKVLARKLIDLDSRYYKIDPYTYDTRVNALENDAAVDRIYNQFDIDVKHGKLSAYDGAVRKAEFKYEGGNSKLHARTLLDIDFEHGIVDDYAYETRLNHIESEDEADCKYHQIDIDVRCNKLTPYEGAVKRVELEYADALTTDVCLKRDLALLDVEYEFGRLEKNAYEKRRATMKNEPWVGFVDSGFDKEQGLDGFSFELDFNQQWIEYLRLHGFVGHTDEQILEEWFTEVCRTNVHINEPNVVVLGPQGFEDGI